MENTRSLKQTIILTAKEMSDRISCRSFPSQVGKTLRSDRNFSSRRLFFFSVFFSFYLQHVDMQIKMEIPRMRYSVKIYEYDVWQYGKDYVVPTAPLIYIICYMIRKMASGQSMSFVCCISSIPYGIRLQFVGDSAPSTNAIASPSQ